MSGPAAGEEAACTGGTAWGKAAGWAAARPAAAEIKAANWRQLGIKGSQRMEGWRVGTVQTWGLHNAWLAMP
jgi:hypothetical protein